jgi:hypothetical protein
MLDSQVPGFLLWDVEQSRKQDLSLWTLLALGFRSITTPGTMVFCSLFFFAAILIAVLGFSLLFYVTPIIEVEDLCETKTLCRGQNRLLE